MLGEADQAEAEIDEMMLYQIISEASTVEHCVMTDRGKRDRFLMLCRLGEFSGADIQFHPDSSKHCYSLVWRDDPSYCDAAPVNARHWPDELRIRVVYSRK